MTTKNRKKDDELLIWGIVGGIFTLFLIGIDIWYSSFNTLPFIPILFLWIAHAGLGIAWIMSIANWKNPNYDIVRRLIVAVSIILSLIIGVHHSLQREDKQVIIDSNANKRSDSLKLIRQDSIRELKTKKQIDSIMSKLPRK